MKVICIDGVNIGENGITSETKNKCFAQKWEEIYEGEIYTPINFFSRFGENYYNLLEKGWFVAYNTKRFAPCSHIDETELINQREEVA